MSRTSHMAPLKPSDACVQNARELLTAAIEWPKEAGNVDAVRLVPADAWPDGLMQYVAKAVCNLNERGEQIEVGAVLIELKSINPSLDSPGCAVAELTSVSSTCNPERCVREILDDFLSREFVRRARHLAEVAPNLSPDERRAFLGDLDLESLVPSDTLSLSGGASETSRELKPSTVSSCGESANGLHL